MNYSHSSPSTLSGKHCFVIVPFLITIITLLIYSNTFSSSFHFDDMHSIIKNNTIRNFSNFLNPSDTRYTGRLSFAINYHFGRLNVFGYHLVNIMIHIINGVLVWWLVILTFKTPIMERSAVNTHLNNFIALSSSLIFITHPIQTQAITYIVQRHASLVTLFYLLSIVCFAKWRLSSGSRFRLVFYLFSIISIVFAMKTKENSFTLPFVILLYEFLFFNGRVIKAYYLIPHLLTLSIIPLTRIGINKPLGDIIGELGDVAHEAESISRGTYLLTQFRVIVTYIRLLFLPVNQNLDYDYPIYHSLFIPEVFLSFLFLLSIAGLAIYLFVRSRMNGNSYALLISFGILWFFMTLSVESSIVPIRDVIFEHRLYLPSVGAIVAFTSAAQYGFEYWKRRIGINVSPLLITCIFLLMTVLPLSLATYQRNRVWENEVTLWEDVVGKSPLKARGYNNLGVVYNMQGRMDEAIKVLSTALRLKPDYVDAHHNLGVAYAKKGRMDEAIEEYKAVLRMEPYIVEVHNNLGVAYTKGGRMDEAIEEFKTALQLKPDYAEAHHNLGIVFQKLERMDKAIEEYKTALRLKPDYAEAHYDLGVAYAKQGRIDEAREEYRIAVRLNPNLAKTF